MTFGLGIYNITLRDIAICLKYRNAYITYFCGPETLYSWTGRAFISSSVIEGAVGTLSESRALSAS